MAAAKEGAKKRQVRAAVMKLERLRAEIAISIPGGVPTSFHESIDAAQNALEGTVPDEKEAQSGKGGGDCDKG